MHTEAANAKAAEQHAVAELRRLSSEHAAAAKHLPDPMDIASMRIAELQSELADARKGLDVGSSGSADGRAPSGPLPLPAPPGQLPQAAPPGPLPLPAPPVLAQAAPPGPLLPAPPRRPQPAAGAKGNAKENPSALDSLQQNVAEFRAAREARAEQLRNELA